MLVVTGGALIVGTIGVCMVDVGNSGGGSSGSSSGGGADADSGSVDNLLGHPRVQNLGPGSNDGYSNRSNNDIAAEGGAAGGGGAEFTRLFSHDSDRDRDGDTGFLSDSLLSSGGSGIGIGIDVGVDVGVGAEAKVGAPLPPRAAFSKTNYASTGSMGSVRSSASACTAEAEVDTEIEMKDIDSASCSDGDEDAHMASAQAKEASTEVI